MGITKVLNIKLVLVGKGLIWKKLKVLSCKKKTKDINCEFWVLDEEEFFKRPEKEDDESLGLRAVREKAAPAMRQIKRHSMY